jgi:isopenicillin N synthase-like dioxygenase
MATSTLRPQSIPEPSLNSDGSPPDSLPTILEEVRAAQNHLRARLAGALTKPPPNIPESQLPTVPLIDLAPSFDGTASSRKAIASQIRSACLTTGFFQISNHSIPESATTGILHQAKRFFHDLTPSQKDALHIRHSALFRGYEPGNYTFVNPDDDSSRTNDAPPSSSPQTAPNPETKEGFNWGYEPSLDPTGGDGAYVELDGHPPTHNVNVWPPETSLPGFHAAIASYYGHVLRLARHLCRLFALSLNLDENYFGPLITHPGGIGRLLYYPAQPAAPQQQEDQVEGKLGLGAHTDYECFTLLLSSPQPGLEILFPPSPNTSHLPLWRPCPIRPGTLTVNVADFLMRWTDGLYKSTVHRVVSRPGAGERYSVPFFFSVNYDADVEPLPTRGRGGEGEGQGQGRYRRMRAGEYVLERLRATKTLGEGVDDVGRD